MFQGFKKVALTALGVAFLASNSHAIQPTAEQMQMFQSLPPSQQQALAKQYGFDLPSGLAGGSTQQQFIEEPLPQKRIQPGIGFNDLAFRNSASFGTEEEGKLKRFGLNVFATQPTTFAPLSNVPVTDNYILGPGDSIQIQLFGKENNSYEFTVSRDGQIHLPELGPISVGGMSFKATKQAIAKIIQEQKIGVRSSVTMGKLKTIEVFVLGDAYLPGKYMVNSLSTMTHALYASGGVNEQGSLRDIRLLRNGQFVQRLDLYDLFMKGDSSSDLRLRAGDVVFIAPLGDTASVDGAVVRPAIYELKAGESIGKLLSYAGGFTTRAYSSEANLERITGDGFIDLLTLNLDEKATLSKKAKNGDFLTITEVAKNSRTYVEVKGNAERPGKYQWREGMRVSSIFQSIHRSFSKSSDLDYSLIVRQKDERGTIEVVQFDLGDAIANKNGENDIELQKEDQILVFTKYDLKAYADELLKRNQDKDIISLEQAQTEQFQEQVIAQQNQMAVPTSIAQGHNQTLAGSQQQMQQGQLQSGQFHQGQSSNIQNPQGAAFGQVPGQQAGMQTLSKEQLELINVSHSTGYNLQELEIITKVTGYTPETLEKTINATRKNLLAPVVAAIFEQSDYQTGPQLVEVSGEVKFPGVYPISAGAKVSDLVAAAGGLTSEVYTAKAELVRTKSVNNQKNSALLELDLALVLSNDQSQNLQLFSRDRLNVLSIPELNKQRTVTIQGEVRFPGTYVIERGEKLSDVLQRAGGLTPYAHVDGAVFTREALRLREQQQLDSYAESIRQEVAKMSFRKTGAGSMTATSSPSEQMELIEEMARVQALGRMVIDLPGIVKGQENRDFILEDQDLLFVPQFRNTVTIMGEVQIGTSYLLDDSLGYKDYINRAGGMKKQADEDRVFVVRANGSVYKPESGYWFGNNKKPLQPGDTIVVPVDTDYRDALSTWTAVTQIMYQIGVAVNAINK